MPDMKIGDKTSFGFVIYVSEGDNMVSHWEDYIFLNKRKDGKFSIKAYKLGENFRSPNRYVWIPIDSVIGVKSVADFISAVSRVERSLALSVDWPDVIYVMKGLDVEMANALNHEMT